MQLRFIHRYIGLLLCLVMLIISITGVLLVWKREYLWITIADARQTQDASHQTLANAIQKISDTHPSGSVQLIQTYSQGLALHKVFLEGRQYAWHSQHGALIQQWSSNERLEDWLLDLHHRFLLGNTVGLNIAGFGGLLLIPLIFAGFWLWWPRRRSFKLSLLPSSSKRGALMRSHSNLGALSALPILLVAITGVILVYPTESQTVFLGGKPSANKIAVNDLSMSTGDWLERLNYSAKLYPESSIRWLSLANKGSPQNIIGLQQAQAWNQTGKTSIYFEASGDITTRDALQRASTERLLDFSYPLHIGSLGLWYRLCLTGFGLALMLVSVLGLMSYVRSRVE